MKAMRFLFAVVTFLSCSVAVASELAPDQLLKKVTDEVLEVIRNDKEIKSGDTRRAMELVETRVVGHFNFSRMTQLAVGREWRKATPEQKKLLTDEFRKLLVRTYSNALTQYKNQTVAFKPLDLKAGQIDAKVRTEIRQPGTKPLNLDYYMEKSDASWRVYDIEVEGISLVTNYRGTFSSEIQEGGLDGLIASLRTKNSAVLVGSRASKT
ncbi:MAG: ABC transporter substrate-binding protein [Rhodocyclaceae bacterium]|jgi:phospholipid transport system substrate-binding protein|nr:ABC transporter substrate-binding protein [Rhodocyclaceae bacterium]